MPRAAIAGTSSRKVARQLLDRPARGMGLRELLHQPAERALAVSLADRLERAVQARPVARQVAVVREDPVAAPQLAHERVRVLERDAALRRLADVGDDVPALDHDDFALSKTSSKIMFDNMAHQEILSLTLKQLRYAVAAADAGNVTQAAQSLHVSQPSISVAIAQIETHYGRKLFVRHKGEGVELTSFGASFMRDARKILDGAGKLHRLGQPAQEASGEVTLGCFTDLAPYYGPALLSQFGKAKPEITVDFRDAGFDELARQIGKGAIDLALTYDLGLGSGIERRTLVELRPYAMLSARHPLARHGSVTLADLAHHPVILTDQALSWQHIVALFNASGLEIDVAARTSSFELQRSMVANSLGVAVAYTRPRSDQSYDGRKLAIRPISDELPAQRILIAWARGQALTPAARVLRDFIKSRFAA